MTRVDLAYAASLYGRFNGNPTRHHMDALGRAYAYANGTRDVGITYTRQEPKLLGYVDADWAGCLDSRKSTTGYMFILAGGPISWSSTIQKVIAQSTCEAEYMALGEAVKEAIWLKSFINDLDIGIHFNTVPIHVDNQSAIKLAKNPEFHQRSKHIDLRHHFLRQHVRDNTIELRWISGKENPADMLTKALDPIKFEAICRNIGLFNQDIAMSTTSHTSQHKDSVVILDSEDTLRQLLLQVAWLEQQHEDAEYLRILEAEWLADTYGITEECEEAWREMEEREYVHLDLDDSFHPYWDVYGRQRPDYDSDTDYSLHGTIL